MTPRPPQIEEPTSGTPPATEHELSKQAESIKQRLEGTPVADEPKSLLQVPQADDLHAWLAAKEHELKKVSGEILPGDLETMRKNDEVYAK